MKKTISVNISGFIFNIEEDAYDVMLDYLNTLKEHLKKTEGGEEIYADIESRIAELFQERLNENKQVINDVDTSEVIAIIGKPEEYLFEDEMETESETEATESEEFEYEGERRVFRDTDNSVIGGVCSGIARYFDVDPILIRLAFALLFFGFGTGVLLYIILWIIIPEPKNNADRLRMHGKPINMENLKEQFQKVKGNPKRKKNAQKTADFAREVGGNFFGVFGKVLGFGMIFFALFFSVILISIAFGNFGIFTDEDGYNSVTVMEFSNIVFQSSWISFFAWLGIVFVSLAPIIGMLVWGVQLVSNVKNKFAKATNWTLVSIFSVGWIILVLVGIYTAREFSDEAEYEEGLYNISNTDIIYVDVLEDEYFSSHIDFEDFEVMELIQVHDDFVLVGYPELSIQASPDTSYHVITIYSSRGITGKSAVRKAENIIYDIEKKNNHIYFSPYYKFPKEDKFRGQTVEVIVQVPTGKKISFGPNTSRILNRLDGDRDLDYDRVNKTYEMRGKRLILAD
ncbi:MAG: PspC domain-containing protein [Crocinitomicaceae bacterium]